MQTVSTAITARYLNVNGANTRYYEGGSGPAMVLIHGDEFGGAATAHTWSLNLPGLAQRFRVLAPDRLGQGFTDHPATDADYTVEAVGDHIYAFTRALGLDAIHLVGQSRGAYFAARLALEHPTLVKTLILTDTASLAPEVGDTASRMANIIAGAPSDPRDYARFRWTRMSFSPAHITDDYLDDAEAVARLPQTAAFKARRAELMDIFMPSLGRQKDETLEWLHAGRLTMPTLMVWGQNDPLAPLDCGLALFELLVANTPRVRMHIFNQAGHFPYREYPAEFNALVTTFIDHWSAAG